ncbi:MAG: putative Ig domain-containing protein [Nitrospirota bacterium]|nr:putative Ig domain-containing protein [Nitrospirota bacterium]
MMRALGDGIRWLTMERLTRALLGVAACGLTGVLLGVGGCGSGGSGGGSSPVASQTGSVSGQVTTLVSGVATPVAGATVSTSVGSTTSGGDGRFAVPAPVGDRAVIHVEAAGYAEAFPVVRVTTGQTTGLGVRLLATGASSVITVSSGGTVTVPNSTAQVTLPADGLVPKNGGAVAGTVNVSLTPINPADDPRVMPGNYRGVSAGGVKPIESFGALLVDARDNSGARYTVALGRTATIRIPLGTLSTNPPATIPLYYFDERTGLWQEEGTATLQGTAPNRYYEGTVSHFSYWNADQGWTPVFVSGCVRDSQNQPVPNLMVQADGRTYSGSDFDITGPDGTFRVAVRQGGQATVSVVEFSLQTFVYSTVTNVVTVGPSTIDFTLPNCLVKAAAPLMVTMSVLPGGNVGQTYSHTLAATGGIPGYVWSLNPGSNPLPGGLSLNPSGVISGTPTTVGTTTITVRVSDSAGETATQSLSVTVSRVGALRITSLSPLRTGVVGEAYSTTLEAVDGVSSLSWSISSGALPAGMILSPTTGLLSGTPTTRGTSTFTIRVQDSGSPQQLAEQPFTLTINALTTGGGTLTLINAPASVGGTFVTNPQFTNETVNNTSIGIGWIEDVVSNHSEILSVTSDPRTGVVGAGFLLFESGTSSSWGCFTVPPPFQSDSPCVGLTIDRVAGTATFVNTAIQGSTSAEQPITLNGTLFFTPF